MIERIYLDNIRTFVNFEWKPPPLALILGGNGSGKTALVQTLRDLQGFLAGLLSAEEAFPSSSRTRWEDQRLEQRVELDVRLPEGLFRYRLLIEQDARAVGQPRIKSETLHRDDLAVFEQSASSVDPLIQMGGAGVVLAMWMQKRSAMAFADAGSRDSSLGPFKAAVSRWWLFRPDPRRIGARLEVTQLSSRFLLAPDLANFADWYVASLRARPKAVFQALRSLEPMIPGLIELYEESGWLHARFEVSGKTTSFRLDELSDGQRALLALYLLRHVAMTPGSLLSLDEPDNYVALAEIQPWLLELERAALKSGGPQVWLISHHPEVINLLAPEHGWRFFRDGMGPTRVERFQATPALTAAETVARGWDDDPQR